MFKLQKLRSIQVSLPRITLTLTYSTVFALIALWLACALWSYDKQDPSIFYISSYQDSCLNMCGMWGAQTASLLFFLCGSSAYILIFFILFIAYCLYNPRRNFKLNSDAVIAYIVSIAACAGLCSLYGFDPLNEYVPGGVLGYLVKYSVRLLHDDFIAKLFLVVVLSSTVIIASRISFVVVGSYSLKLFTLLMKLFVYSMPCIQACIRRLKLCMQSIRHLLNGSEIEKSAHSVVEFEWGIDKSSSDEHDTEAFWNKRFAKTPHQEPYSENVQHVTQQQVIPPRIVQKSEKKKSYTIPPVSLFTASDTQNVVSDHLKGNQLLAKVLEEKLARFGIYGSVISIKVGPVITLFEYQPHIDSKISKIVALEDDLALALQAVSIRIIAPIPGKSVVGFEVANKYRRTVLLGKALQSEAFQNASCYLPLVLGEDSIGSTVIVDLATMPHLLVAGSTGSGKSVGLNAMLISLLSNFLPIS